MPRTDDLQQAAAGARRRRPDSTPQPFGAPRTIVVAGAAVRVLGAFRPVRSEIPKQVERPRGASPAVTGHPRLAVAAAHTTTPTPAAAPPRAPALPIATGYLRPDDLSPAVRRLLWYALDSVDKILVFQLARVTARPWTTEEAVAALALPERAVVAAIFGLCQAELLRRHGETFTVTPRAGVIGAALDVLHRAHGADPREILSAIGRLAHGRAAT